MTVDKANQIIENLRNQYGFGLLEMLEIMTDELEYGGDEIFEMFYTAEERHAYRFLMAEFRQFFAIGAAA